MQIILSGASAMDMFFGLQVQKYLQKKSYEFMGSLMFTLQFTMSDTHSAVLRFRIYFCGVKSVVFVFFLHHWNRKKSKYPYLILKF